MTTPPPHDVIGLIENARSGDPAASRALFEAVYQDLRSLATAIMRSESGPRTLQPTALVHEAYMRVLGGSKGIAVENRRHLFGVFALAMRRILIDAARARGAEIRGDGHPREPLMPDGPFVEIEPSEFIVIADLIDRFEQEQPRGAEIVRLRIFAGRTMDEISELLATPKRSIERDWQFARVWLLRQLRSEE